MVMENPPPPRPGESARPPEPAGRERPRLHDIPKGNTCRGVNRAIIEFLLGCGDDLGRARFLDIPCGPGAFMRTLRDFFPDATVKGCDIHPPESLPASACTRVDASRPFTVFSETQFDVITSISGVMEFDNTRQFFESCAAHLRENGRLIVTNDNLVSVRDRLAYLAFGKARQFGLFPDPDKPTWKMIPVQNLVRILYDAGFVVREIRYVSARFKDWALLPLALLLWPGQLLYVRMSRSVLGARERAALFPFRSLICRHYILVCAKR